MDECVARLKRAHYAFRRLHGIFIARITAEPIYELKMAFSYHAYLCAEHVSALRTRVGEMREPPLGLEEVPHPALEQFFDEVLAAPTTAALVEASTGVPCPHSPTRSNATSQTPICSPTRQPCGFAGSRCSSWTT